MVIATDRAGNTSVAAFEQGEAMGNYVNLAAEKTILDPGETLTIRNTAENQYDMQIEWTNNNPEILEILESDGYSCTIRALAPGAASVSGGFGPYAKSLDITVRDPAGAHCRAVSGHCKSLGQGGDHHRHPGGPLPRNRRQHLLPGDRPHPGPAGHRAPPPGRHSGGHRQQLPGCGRGPVLHRGRGMGQGNRPGEGRYPRAVLPQQPCDPGAVRGNPSTATPSSKARTSPIRRTCRPIWMPGSSAIMPSPPWHGL